MALKLNQVFAHINVQDINNISTSKDPELLDELVKRNMEIALIGKLLTTELNIIKLKVNSNAYNIINFYSCCRSKLHSNQNYWYNKGNEQN